MRKTTVIVQIVIMLLFICTSSVCGFGGAKALGMGNAFVAIADDGTAPYWNPACITQMNFGVTAGVSGNPLSDYWYYNAALHGGITTKYLAINMFGYSFDDISEIDFVGTIGIPIGKQLAIGGNYKSVNPEVYYNGYTYNGSGQSY